MLAWTTMPRQKRARSAPSGRSWHPRLQTVKLHAVQCLELLLLFDLGLSYPLPCAFGCKYLHVFPLLQLPCPFDAAAGPLPSCYLCSLPAFWCPYILRFCRGSIWNTRYSGFACHSVVPSSCVFIFVLSCMLSPQVSPISLTDLLPLTVHFCFVEDSS